MSEIGPGRRRPYRAEMLKRLRTEEFDLAVVGGGITGAWIARDAALRGLKVALVERGDFASGTSSRSSRLVHGGLRYLQHRHISLVRESLRERGLLLRLAPHLVRPIQFLIPVYEGDRYSPLLLRAGLMGYDVLAGSRRIGWHRRRSGEQVEADEPALRREGLRSGFTYFDAITDDARLTLTVVLGAIENGGTAANYVEAVSWEEAAGHVAGVNCRDTMTGETFTVRAKCVAGAAGPWSDELRAMARGAPVLRPTKGIHIVVPRERLRTASAVAFFHDGRPYFAVPAGRSTYVGTTDTDWTGDAGEAVATAEDVRGVLDGVNASFDVGLGVDDVTATWAGVRPLVAEEGSPAPSDVSRDYEILEGPRGVYTICGGKLTSARSMAEEVVGRIVEKERGRLSVRVGRCRTDRVRLSGAGTGFDGFKGEAVHDLQRNRGVSAEVADHLLDTYGTRYSDVLATADDALLARVSADSATIGAEVAYAVSNGMAMTLLDFMRRRSDLMLFGPGAKRDVAAAVAGVMAPVRGWDVARIEAEVEEYMREAEGMLSFRQMAAATEK